MLFFKARRGSSRSRAVPPPVVAVLPPQEVVPTGTVESSAVTDEQQLMLLPAEPAQIGNTLPMPHLESPKHKVSRIRKSLHFFKIMSISLLFWIFPRLTKKRVDLLIRWTMMYTAKNFKCMICRSRIIFCRRMSICSSNSVRKRRTSTDLPQVEKLNLEAQVRRMQDELQLLNQNYENEKKKTRQIQEDKDEAMQSTTSKYTECFET